MTTSPTKTESDGTRADAADAEKSVPQVSSMETVLCEIRGERERQNRKWGGPSHDDGHERHDFVRFIREHLDEARRSVNFGDLTSWRKEMIEIAALCVAAVEMHARKEARQ